MSVRPLVGAQELGVVGDADGGRRSGERTLDRITLEAAVVAEATGCATTEERTALEAQPMAWVGALRRLLVDTDEAVASAGRLTGDERQQVLADLTGERRALAAALERLTGESPGGPTHPEEGAGQQALHHQPAHRQSLDHQPQQHEPLHHATTDNEPPAPARLQGSWADGRVVVWAAGRGSAALALDGLDGLLEQADAGGITWEHHAPVPLPLGARADARAAPIGQTLGWLVGVGAGQVGRDVGASLAWMGEIAVWGAELVAAGRMVPVLRGTTASGGVRTGPTRHRVRWVPALVARDRLADLVARMPGAVVALQSAPQAEGVCRSVLSAVVDAVSRAGADRLVTPATVSQATTRLEISEAVLSGLDGRPFSAEPDPATRVADDLKRWAAPVTVSTKIGLTVRLEPPADDGGWLLRVEATGVDKAPLPVEHALVVASGTKSQQVEAQMRRLERLLPVLRRPSTRRGQVILDAEEASDLMFNAGPAVAAAGFDVLLPLVSRRRPAPQLRLFAEALGGPSQVGVAQLSNVRWSVVFDDLELDAAGIAKLAAEARPLVKVKGRWVHIDRADLAAAAAALAERASITQLSGAALLRHAVGLEGGGLGGPLRVDGHGWAVDLVRGATTNPPAPLAAPDGFVGQLRHYQADAAGWLGFLDRGSLGGCLAMDMGLGKTPTLLAHLVATRGEGPTLIVCPPAVLSNWANEAARFTPGLSVTTHHGPRRADAEGLAKLAATHDVVLTTYATAVRDIEAVARIDWGRLAIDEAQAIKNHTSDTARALRRIPARSRLALTGTPVENGLGDLWAILDFTNPGLVGGRTAFIEHLSHTGDKRGGAEEGALRALNGLLVYRRTKTEPEIAAELPDKVDKLDHCGMTPEQVGLYQAVVDRLIDHGLDEDSTARKGQVLAAITALKQICDHPAAYLGDNDTDGRIDGRSGKLARLEEIVDDVFAAGERVLVFTHFARWGEKLSKHLSARTGTPVGCYHGGLSRTTRDELVEKFQSGIGPGALVLSIKAGGSGLNLTAARHVVLYDRWWNPAVEDQARDRAWRIGQTSTVVSHRLVCPGTVDERVEEIVAGKRQVAGLVLPARSSLGDLDAAQLRTALGLAVEEVIEEEPAVGASSEEEAA